MRAPAPRPQVLHVRCGHSRRAHRLCTSDAGARAAPTRTSTAQGAGTAQARSGVKRPRSRRPAAKRQLKARAPRRCSAHLAGPACGRRSRRAARPRILRFHRRCAARRAIRAGARRRRRGVVDRRPCARPRAGRGHGAWARVCSGGRAGDQRDAHAHAGAALHTERDADRPLAARGRRGGGRRPARLADGGRGPRARRGRPCGHSAVVRARSRRRRGQEGGRGGTGRAWRVPSLALLVFLQAGGSEVRGAHICVHKHTTACHRLSGRDNITLSNVLSTLAAWRSRLQACQALLAARRSGLQRGLRLGV
jgi:hypothetical protein